MVCSMLILMSLDESLRRNQKIVDVENWIVCQDEIYIWEIDSLFLTHYLEQITGEVNVRKTKRYDVVVI